MSIRTVSPLVIAAELGRYARSRLDHLTDGRPLYIPGFDTEADPVVATGTAALYRHPYSVSQLPLLTVHFDTMLDPALSPHGLSAWPTLHTTTAPPA